MCGVCLPLKPEQFSVQITQLRCAIAFLDERRLHFVHRNDTFANAIPPHRRFTGHNGYRWNYTNFVYSISKINAQTKHRLATDHFRLSETKRQRQKMKKEKKTQNIHINSPNWCSTIHAQKHTFTEMNINKTCARATRSRHQQQTTNKSTPPPKRRDRDCREKKDRMKTTTNHL